MIEMMGDAAYAVRKAEPLPAPKPPEKAPVQEPEAKQPKSRRQKTEQQADELQAMLDQTAAEEKVLEPVADFDPDRLFEQSIDENLADSMFDPDALSELAASMDAEGGERVGYDEAIDMGILDE
jgi:hypothetical protein